MIDIRQWWDDLASETRAKYAKYGTAFVFLTILLISYNMTDRSEKKPPEDATKSREISLGTDLLEDDIRATVEKDMEVKTSTDKDQSRRLESMELMLSEISKKNLQLTDIHAETGPTMDDLVTETEKPHYPPPPVFPNKAITLTDDVAPPEPVIIGAIGRATGVVTAKKDTTKKKRTVYLPPSFMEAVLLSGVKADTMEDAAGNPEPIMIRVQAPAVLPNSLKADLKGCFVTANAVGKLNKERVEARLVSLSCMSLDGQAVIDQEVKGFVVDKADGVKGLSGHVVSKMAAPATRAFVAGIFEGIGETASTSNATTTFNPLGSTQVLDSDKALQAGIGHGIKSGAHEIQQVFLDLVRQSSPVIEVGPLKKLTVVIQEGVELEIKEKQRYEDIAG